VNYLAGFLLTRLLLPTLRRFAPARIVHVAS
jgi:NAD(P)-dependent dehydrogenase (short-subunit alcohol dehydrogenase family)